MIYLYKEQKIIFYVLLLSAAINLLITPIYTIGVSTILKLHFAISNQMFGLAQGIIGFGMILGAILVLPLSKKIPFSNMHYYFCILTAIICGMGICTSSFWLHPSTQKSLACFSFIFFGFCFSMTISIINISFFTILQKNTPSHMMGKIMAIVTSISAVFMPIGQIIYGYFFQLFANKTIFIYFLASGCTLCLSLILYKILSNPTLIHVLDAKESLD